MSVDTAVTKRDEFDADQLRRATLASSIGSALEYYDFYIFGLATALVFGPLFFAPFGDAATIASFATFGIAYVARPLGGLLFGFIGDRFGRKMVGGFKRLVQRFV